MIFADATKDGVRGMFSQPPLLETSFLKIALPTSSKDVYQLTTIGDEHTGSNCYRQY
jgi:hypothetical protein